MGGFMNSNEIVIRMYTECRFAYREYFLYNVENGYQQQFRLIPEGQAHEEFLRRINMTTESLLLTETYSLCSYSTNEQYWTSIERYTY